MFLSDWLAPYALSAWCVVNLSSEWCTSRKQCDNMSLLVLSSRTIGLQDGCCLVDFYDRKVFVLVGIRFVLIFSVPGSQTIIVSYYMCNMCFIFLCVIEI